MEMAKSQGTSTTNGEEAETNEKVSDSSPEQHWDLAWNLLFYVWVSFRLVLFHIMMILTAVSEEDLIYFYDKFLSGLVWVLSFNFNDQLTYESSI